MIRSRLVLSCIVLYCQVATGKKKIADLEDEILRLLSESTGSLLDDMNLVNTLQDSKTISEEVTQQLQVTNGVFLGGREANP